MRGRATSRNAIANIVGGGRAGERGTTANGRHNDCAATRSVTTPAPMLRPRAADLAQVSTGQSLGRPPRGRGVAPVCAAGARWLHPAADPDGGAIAPTVRSPRVRGARVRASQKRSGRQCGICSASISLLRACFHTHTHTCVDAKMHHKNTCTSMDQYINAWMCVRRASDMSTRVASRVLEQRARRPRQLLLGALVSRCAHEAVSIQASQTHVC